MLIFVVNICPARIFWNSTHCLLIPFTLDWSRNLWHNPMWNMAVNNIPYPIYPLSTRTEKGYITKMIPFFFCSVYVWILFGMCCMYEFCCRMCFVCEYYCRIRFMYEFCRRMSYMYEYSCSCVACVFCCRMSFMYLHCYRMNAFYLCVQFYNVLYVWMLL